MKAWLTTKDGYFAPYLNTARAYFTYGRMKGDRHWMWFYLFMSAEAGEI